MPFEFATSGRIVFGPGTISQATAAARTFGRRVFIVVNSMVRSSTLIDQLMLAGLIPLPFLIKGEPTIATVSSAVQAARNAGCDLVLGMGGGSALDLGKAVAALLTNPGDIYDYLEVVGGGEPLEQPSAPCIAIPTTAGTGSEVTRNAVITVPEQRTKVSLRSLTMLPRIAIIDPELTCSMPPAITASTGLDALTQLIEPFVSNSSNKLTDPLCREGIACVARSLKKACENSGDASAREDMALASLFGGLALANARLGAVHGFANPIGGMYSAPHGAICARLLPNVIEANIHALKSRQPKSPALKRYEEVAQLLTGNPQATALEGAKWIRKLIDVLKIHSLSEYGIKPTDFPTIVARAQKATSMRGNPIELTEKELITVLEKAS